MRGATRATLTRRARGDHSGHGVANPAAHAVHLQFDYAIKGIIVGVPSQLTFIRGDEKTGLLRDAIRSQRLRRSRRNGKETGL